MFGGIVALSLVARKPDVPSSLALVSSYAGWRGSLSEEDVEARQRNCLRMSELSPEEFARAMVPSMFSAAADETAVERFAASVRRFSPVGFRTMTLASAEADLRHLLPGVRVPTLPVHGDRDERAPLEVAEGIRDEIPSCWLVVRPGVGHLCPVEAPEEVNRAFVDFLRSANQDVIRREVQGPPFV